MTGAQLKAIRESRGLTQNELAAFLGDTTHGTVSKWEKDVHAIPQWVADKMMTSTQLTLPLDMLQQLMDYATTHQMEFSELLTEALRAYLRRPKIVDYSGLPPMEELRVAEEPLD